MILNEVAALSSGIHEICLQGMRSQHAMNSSATLANECHQEGKQLHLIELFQIKNSFRVWGLFPAITD